MNPRDGYRTPSASRRDRGTRMVGVLTATLSATALVATTAIATGLDRHGDASEEVAGVDPGAARTAAVEPSAAVQSRRLLPPAQPPVATRQAGPPTHAGAAPTGAGRADGARPPATPAMPATRAATSPPASTPPPATATAPPTPVPPPPTATGGS